MKKATFHRHLKLLVEQGYIERFDSRHGKRLRLTEVGREQLSQEVSPSLTPDSETGSPEGLTASHTHPPVGGVGDARPGTETLPLEDGAAATGGDADHEPPH